jgi:membrane-bound lytic murein transglycosylase A
LEKSVANSLRAFTFIGVGVAALGCFIWAIFVGLQDRKPPALPAVPISYVPTTYASLDGWALDDHLAALGPLTRSCAKLDGRPDTYAFSNLTFPDTDVLISGTAKQWRAICAAAKEALTQEASQAGLQAGSFFETWFAPFQVTGPSEADNLFTAYYEPVIQGSRAQSEAFKVPLLARPEDLVQVDLGTFRPHLRGERIAGRVKGGHLKPYESRAQIEAGALGAVPAVIYLQNPVDAFFTQIQGSARIELTDGTSMRVNYAGQNGHPYTAIGGPLIRRGEIPREKMSMQAIRDWLESHPEEAQDLMNQNASFVFFREVQIADDSLGPIGAQGIPLTTDRSLAVDRKFHPLGLPFWVETNLPLEEVPATEEVEGEVRDLDPVPLGPTFNHLMIAQDTGGAIRGPVRGDLFFGTGKEAAMRAGPMKQPGQLFILVPKEVAGQYLAALADLAAPAPVAE